MTQISVTQFNRNVYLYTMINGKHNAVTIRAMRTAKIGHRNPNWNGMYYVTPLGRFVSLTEAAAAHDTYTRKIYRMCKAGKPGFRLDLVMDARKLG